MSGFCASVCAGLGYTWSADRTESNEVYRRRNGAIPPVELRKHCKDFAMMHVKNQMAQFKRLAVWDITVIRT